MATLILITPVLRTKNLPLIAKNIIKVFKDEKDIRPHWILCFDKYHADMNPLLLKKLEVQLLEGEIRYTMFIQGEPGTANYGGALMNKPLEQAKTMYPEEDPFVYILDDDNILSPNLLKYMKDNVLSDTAGKVWWMNMLDEFGTQRFSRMIDRLSGRKGEGVNNGYYVIHPCASCDPSQVIIRLSAILDLGGYGKTRAYDYEFMNLLLRNKNNINFGLRCQASRPNMRDQTFYMSCYHNGLVTREDIQAAIDDLEAGNYEYDDSYVRVHIGKNMFNIPLGKEELREVLSHYKVYGIK